MRIYCKFFMLLKTMLSSTNFKEGQNRRIELPGKKFNEVVYFLQFLHTLQDIKDDTNIWALAPLCQEYQVDWLSNKIESFIRNCATNRTKTILNYLVLAEDMHFGIEVERSLVSKLLRGFQNISMCLEFLLLSRRMQVWIARRKLADSLKKFLIDPYFDTLPRYGKQTTREKKEAGIKKYKAVDADVVSIFHDLDQPKMELINA
eukprot:TCONS_00067242-protein